MGIIDLLSGLFVVKQLVKLWPEMAKDLISVFLGMKPFSSQFLYIFRLLNFFFNSDYYAILMSNSFTIVHFCTLMPPLKLVFFHLHSKQLIQWFISTYVWQQRQQSIISWRTASCHCSTQQLSFSFFHPSTGTSQVKTLTQKNNKKTVKTIQIYLC